MGALDNHKVLFVTNGVIQTDSLLWESMKTYFGLIDNNFYLIPGFVEGKQYYGFNAFIEMIGTALSKNYQYIIYIDEDCFIKDCDLLVQEFKKFCMSGKPVAGMSDGGCICHRNHNPICINTHLSFWNLKAIREHWTEENFKFLSTLTWANFEKSCTDTFINKLKEEAEVARVTSKNIRDLNNIEVNWYRSCKLFKTCEFSEEPYTVSYDDYEPYYKLILFFIYWSKQSPYYLDVTEVLTHRDPGITNAIYSTINPGKIIAYHTWFGRGWSADEEDIEVMHHQCRIQSIIDLVKNKS